MINIPFLLVMSVAFGADSATGKVDILNEMTSRLLAGKMAPHDIEERLMELSRAERFEVIIFLRRSGILLGRSLSTDRLLTVPSETEALR